MDELEYIVKGALMMCDQGGAPDFFKPTHTTTTKIKGRPVATKADFVPLTNIPSFKICMLTQKPCVPETTTSWRDTVSSSVGGKDALIGRSKCKCNAGGTIEFMTSGQTPLPEDAKAEVEDMQKQAQRTLDDAGYGDSVGEAGFVEGMIPVWGSGRDMINDIQTGDVGGAVMNGAFLLWDVVSIGVGIFSFGGGTVAMQGAKAAVKCTIKTGAKTIAQKALQGLGKSGFKKLLKGPLKKSLDDIAKKLDNMPVRWCFTGDTLIHTKNGLVEIRNIKIDDEVYSYDEEKGEITLGKVTGLFEGEADEILAIQTEKETIRTTRNHPFYVNGEFKDAEQIEKGDVLFSVFNREIQVISLNYVSESIKVYNFVVENEHCYFVGKEGILVHNDCDEVIKNIKNSLIKNEKEGDKIVKKVDLSLFTKRNHPTGGMKKTRFEDPKSHWSISKDIDSHNGGAWKLFDKKGNRIATIGENGEIIGK